MPTVRPMFRLALTFLGLVLAISGAMAQTYPMRPLAFVYPYPPGSATEVAFRAIVQDAAKRLGQPIVFENRSGAVGRIGFEHVLRSPADGYTIGLLNNVLGVSLPTAPERFSKTIGCPRRFAASCTMALKATSVAEPGG